jgi:uncharacterized protein (TIGR02453 family)
MPIRNHPEAGPRPATKQRSAAARPPSKKAPAEVPPPFAGFPKQGVSFFEGLALAQSRDWFQAHKQDYETLWRLPMLGLLAGLRPACEKLYGRKVAPAKLFRLNRDVRFSKDKSPYKTHCAGLLGFGEVSAPDGGVAAIYLHLGVEEYAASGFYQLEPEKLALLRKRILDERAGGRLAKLVAAAKEKGLEVMAMETLKRAPAGIDPAHPRIELLKQKGLALSFPAIPKKVRYSAELKSWLLAHAKAGAPVVQWAFENGLG